MARLPEIPKDLPPHHQSFFKQIYQVLGRIAPSERQAPGRPTNVTVRPLPGGNEVTWTAGDSADGHIVQFSPSPTWNPSNVSNHVIDVGISTHWTHNVGAGGQTLYYWVVAKRGGILSDPPSGPITGISLGLAVPAAPAKYVPPGTQIVQDQETGHSVILTTKRGGGRSTT